LQANGWHVGAHSPCANALDTMESTMGPINHYDILGKCFKPTNTLLNPGSNPSTAKDEFPAAAAAKAGPSSAGVTDYSLLRASRRLQQQQQQQQGQQQQQPQQGQHVQGGGHHEQAAKGLQLASAVGEGRLRTATQLRHAVSCADRRYASVYFNSPEVRAVLHAADERDSGRCGPILLLLLLLLLGVLLLLRVLLCSESSHGAKLHCNSVCLPDLSAEVTVPYSSRTHTRAVLGFPTAVCLCACCAFQVPWFQAKVLCCAVLCCSRWEPCSDVLHYTFTYSSMIGVHRELIEGGVRGLVFSGG
jgi:hypothetical protein